MKKAQISGQIIIYVLSMVIFAGILIYGYSAIQGFSKDQEKVVSLKFEENLKSTVKGVILSYGDVEVFNDRNPLTLPTGYTEMCIIDLNVNAPAGSMASATGQPLTLVKDSWTDKVQKNIFLLDGATLKYSFFAGNITVDDNNHNNRYICFVVNSGRITTMQMEGVGAKANVTKYP